VASTSRNNQEVHRSGGSGVGDLPMSGMTLEDLDRMAAEDHVVPVSELGRPTRFEDEDADEIVRRDSTWLVKGLWPRVGVCFVAGPSMSGKSFWILDQASRIVKSEPVLGRRSVPAGTVYIAAEGANGVRARLEGLRDRVGGWNGQLRFISDAPNLSDPGDVELLSTRLDQISQRATERDQRIGLVIVDTLSASMPGADENSGKDMSLVLQSLQDLARRLEVCLVVVAHLGKDADRGIRGWSGLLANADGAIIIQAPNDEQTRIGQVQKVKDGEAGDKFAFALEEVFLGVDADGDPVSTCVIVERVVPTGKKPNGTSQAGAQGEMIKQAFDRMQGNKLIVTANAAPRGTYGVLLSVLRAKVFEIGFHAETKPEEPEAAEMRRWKDTRKKAFQRAMHKLVESKVFCSEEDWVWAR
jgi:hypothetical protein